MIITNLFWIILGLGVAIPATLVLIFNMVLKIVAGDNYNLDIKKLSIIYFVALVGWSIFFGVHA